MAKALKVIGTIAGAVALVVPGLQAVGAGLMAASTAATVATVAGVVAGVAAIGAQALQKPPPARGSVSQVIVALDPPRPLVMGEGYVGGVVRHDVAYGGTVSKVPNPYLWQVHVFCGCGPVQSITPYADFGTISSWYSGFLYTASQRGLCPETAALSPAWAGAPGWGTASKLSGCAAIGFSARFDKDGKRFASGLPVFGAYGRWAYAYDPRKDSTRSGGSGTHRLANPATWEWTQCPALFAGTYAYGYYQNGKLVMGMGLPDAAIDWTYVADWANVCDGNGWTIFGRVFEPGGPELRWQNLTDICIAGGGKPVFAGGLLSFHYSAPRVSLGTITDKALAEGTQRVTAQKGYAQRINAIVPKYIDPASNWEQVPAQKVVASTLVAEDGEEKLEEFPYNLVKDVDQAAQLAMYRIWDSREISVPEVPLQPGYETIRPGECWTFDLQDMGLVNRDCIVWSRTVEPGTFGVKLALETETTAKHAFALGQTGTPPGTPTLATSAETRDAIADAILLDADLVASVNAALSLAAAKGKVWTTASMPSVAESNVGDTWVAPDGTFYDRVNEGGILLAGTAVTLAGYRPRIAWTLSANQALRDAILTADQAYSAANDAIDQLIGLADDDVLSRNEKITKLVPEVARLEDKWTALASIATSLAVSTTTAASARTAWYTFLGGLSPAWNDITQDTPVARASFNFARDTYDSALYELDRAIKDKAATVSTWAGVTGSGKPQDNATYGALPSEVAAIAAAQADADAAYSAANNAIDALADLASDGVLSRNEKITKLIPENARLEDKWTALSSVATSLSVSTTAAASARSSWNSLLAGLSPAWNDTSQDTPVSRSGYNAARDAYDTALYNLDKDIKAKAATLASWSGVSGSGKPADNATRNIVTYSGLAPASPIDGDLWVDLSGPFAVFKLRSGGAWVTGANALSAYNSLSGTPVALADINTTESSKLAGIQSGATRNIVTYSGTAPASPQDGDLWVDISGTYAVFRLRSGSSWVEGANALTAYNALSGKPIALADINTTESSKLSGIQAGATVGAPTGTPVGTITAGDVSGTINSGGGVANNQVPTPAIQLNAVSVTSDAYTASSKTLASGTWDDVQSITVSATGAPMLILFTGQSSQVTSGVFDILRYRIIRDSTVIYGPIENWTYQDESRGFSLSARDTPPAGTVTYKVQALLVTSGGSASVAYRSLIAIETKR